MFYTYSCSSTWTGRALQVLSISDGSSPWRTMLGNRIGTLTMEPTTFHEYHPVSTMLNVKIGVMLLNPQLFPSFVIEAWCLYFTCSYSSKNEWTSTYRLKGLAQRELADGGPQAKRGPVGERMGSVAYRLKLPKDISIHNVFHISWLQTYFFCTELPKVNNLVVLPTTTETILEGRLSIKVKWTNLPQSTSSKFFSRGHVTASDKVKKYAANLWPAVS